jgi:hypothetical protein
MTKLLNIYRKYFKEESNPIPVAIIVGCLLPLVSWVIEIIIHGIKITPSGILQLHKLNPSLIVIDIVPIILISLAAVIHFQYKESKLQFDDKIRERDKRLEEMAKFAKQIGEGNFNTNLDITSNNDTLAQSL